MKITNKYLVRTLSLMMAAFLQLMPLVRSALVTVDEMLAPSSWAIVFRWAAVGSALFGYDAVSKASSIAISPANAVVGQPYVGIITYSGGHAGSVSSMSFSNTCLAASTTFVDGLTIVYSGGNTATVTGTPTSAGTFAFTLRIFDGSTCGSGNSDSRSTSLVVGTGGGGGVTPMITSPPEGVTAQVGAGALLSAGASGNPAPNYYWYRGLPNIPSNLIGTNAALEFATVQLSDAGLYTVVASNASGSASAPAYLSIVVTPGTNQLALNYTNYALQGQALTMYSYLTNVPTGVNSYKWQFNSVDVTAFSTNGNAFSLTPIQVVPTKSGKYGVVFNSVVGATTVVNQQLYYSYWAFGLPPEISGAPGGTNVSSGSDAVLTATATNISVPPITPSLNAYGTNTPLTFQWFFNGTNLLATQVTNGLEATESFTLHAVTAAAAGEYTVVVSNYWGAVTSSPALLNLAAGGNPPIIALQPSGRAVLAGQNATFAVTATGDDPKTYQWLWNNTALTNNAVYAGVNSSSLTLTGVGPGNAGTYSVAITNAAGYTNSIGVPLDVNLPPTITPKLGPGGLLWTVNTVTGLTYVVQTTTNLTGIWTSIATNAVTDTGLLSFTNTPTNSRQFFRLMFP
ncbi:MAG TPA: immunoglobulin domain-containing protein [Dongiaceae bacterium]|nr:immunoglobulin domain-containing protein [Dongiaceae bacterium]